MSHLSRDELRTVGPVLEPPLPTGQHVLDEVDQRGVERRIGSQIGQKQRPGSKQWIGGHRVIVPSAYAAGVAVLVDPAIWQWRERFWAHLISDESYDELHAFAARLEISRDAFQGDHYDVTTDMRLRAIELGAQAVTGRELIVRLRASGLRRPKRLR